MLARPLLNQILRNESVTRGLADPEARILVEWLVDRADALTDRVSGTSLAAPLETLCRRSRAIGRFVVLWCYQQHQASALQLAAVERFSWPFPEPSIDPCELMYAILSWEDRRWDG